MRSVILKTTRPNFTLSPTNCEPLSISGTAVSVFDRAAFLPRPFQVGGCR